MGIPAFFRQIIENHKNTHSSEIKDNVDYFFIDFNSIIYDIYGEIDKKDTYSTNTKFENYLVSAVIKKLEHIVNNIVKPQKLLYIAFDGPAPRAKMVQQRWRRYKGMKDSLYMNSLKEKYGMEKDNIEWQASANISPGTKFMKKMSKILQSKINIFTKINNNLSVIISDSNVPGEGEHKFLPYIRNNLLKKDDTMVIYSPDADMIVLIMATHKNNSYILRKVKTSEDASNVEKEYKMANKNYLFLSIDKYRNAFIETLDIKNEKNKDNIRLITDYIFLTFLGGNDFVMPLPYLKVRDTKKSNSREFHNSGLGILLNLYVKILNELNANLVLIDGNKYMINHIFLAKIFEELSKSEDYYMRGYQMRINRIMDGQGDEKKLEKEEGKTLYERDVIRYNHYEYYSQLHPFYSEYKNLFKKFDYSQSKNIWKAEYYKHFFNLNPDNITEYNHFRSEICINYIESLLFTLKYYFEEIPSWNWYYRFRASPTASDIFTNLNKYIKNINDFKFDKGTPYKPFDQLMMILPLTMGNLLPKKYQELMKNELLDYYPIDFELDVYLTGKHIYSEPILPYIDDKRVIEETKKINLTKEEEERNKLSDKIIIFNENINKNK